MNMYEWQTYTNLRNNLYFWVFPLRPLRNTFTNTAVLQEAEKGITVDPDGNPCTLVN